MIESDLDDTHLCIKCSSTIVGLENYIEHRKGICSRSLNSKIATSSSHTTTSSTIISSTRATNLNHTYDSFSFTEPEPPTSYVQKTVHGGKTSKSSGLGDTYDLPYELGADVFFSSLQLQSVQSSAPSSTGKTSSNQAGQLQRQKSMPAINQSESAEHTDVAWIDSHGPSTSNQHHTESLMKSISDMTEVKKPFEVDFKPISFVHESPDVTEDEDEEELDDDEDDYEAIARAAHGSGGKWKLPVMRQSPPVVPATHTGGKWKPENRPRVTHTQLSRLSPTWDEQLEEVEVAEVNSGDHPPAEHTKGKWIPGTKLQRLEYKPEVITLAKSVDQHYWCNICCRKLKTKALYEKHLKTSYHRKRAEPEQQLEKAALNELQHEEISKSIVAALEEPTESVTHKKRKRRATYIKCDPCRRVVVRQLIGKHLISHYHYRRLQMNPTKSLRMILDNIHSVVLQSPYQCRPCRFYANSEETFLQHWNSPEHQDASEGPGKFWCSYCRFECEDNNQMRRHLLSADHKGIICAINRSVPICISKKLDIACCKCRQSFRYNMELRQHMKTNHPNSECSGTASDAYQNRHKCGLCGESFHSKVALQRHQKRKHSILKYFCSICHLEFGTPCKARNHRKTLEHRLQAISVEKASLANRHKAQQKALDGTKACSKCDFV